VEVEADGVDFDAASVTTTEIRAQDEYAGIRVKLKGRIGKAVIPKKMPPNSSLRKRIKRLFPAKDHIVIFDLLDRTRQGITGCQGILTCEGWIADKNGFITTQSNGFS